MIPLEEPYLFIFKQRSLGKFCLQKGWKFIIYLSAILEMPISKPTQMGASSASGKSVVMRVFSSHQQQHFIIKRNQKCNFKFKTIFLAIIEPCDLLDMAT